MINKRRKIIYGYQAGLFKEKRNATFVAVPKASKTFCDYDELKQKLPKMRLKNFRDLDTFMKIKKKLKQK